MATNIILNRTSVDTIAIWIQSSPKTNIDWVTASIIPVPIPIFLSAGSGLQQFLTMNQPGEAVVVKTTLNQRTIYQVRQVITSGTIFLHPQSSALLPLRNIITFTSNNLRPVKGTMLIFNLNALLLNKYQNVVWSSTYVGANREATLSEIPITFQCDSPVLEVNLGSYASALGILNGYNISI